MNEKIEEVLTENERRKKDKTVTKSNYDRK